MRQSGPQPATKAWQLWPSAYCTCLLCASTVLWPCQPSLSSQATFRPASACRVNGSSCLVRSSPSGPSSSVNLFLSSGRCLLSKPPLSLWLICLFARLFSLSNTLFLSAHGYHLITSFKHFLILFVAFAILTWTILSITFSYSFLSLLVGTVL